MLKLGFHASQEQFPPEQLLELVQHAERAGFQWIMSSDHFHPWCEEQGQSGYTWSWLGAAMQVTRIPFGSITTPVGWRYHPAIMAQAGATLARMFPDRLAWLAVGSGEALNETIVGDGWPAKEERNARLAEAVGIMRDLWAGQTVTRHGYIRVEGAKLYSRAEKPPKLIAAVLSAETAEWAGSWADGLVTVNQPREALQKIIDGFRRGGGKDKPLYLQAHVSYADSEATAQQLAFEQWYTNVLPPSLSENLRTPEAFAAAAAQVKPEDMSQHVRISSDLDEHAEWLRKDAEMGFEAVLLHNVGVNQAQFINAFGSHVLARFGDEHRPVMRE